MPKKKEKSEQGRKTLLSRLGKVKWEVIIPAILSLIGVIYAANRESNTQVRTSMISKASTSIDKEMRIYNFSACYAKCNGMNSIRTFPKKTKRIYFQWYYENIPVNAEYKRIWRSKYKDGDWQEWARYECVWPGPETGLDDRVVLSEPDGLRSGDWQVIIEVNGTELLNEEFTVKGNWDYFDSVREVIHNCYGLIPLQPTLTQKPALHETVYPSLTP